MQMQGRSGLEIEIKLRVADVPVLIRRLAALGASPEGRVFERNTVYDTTDSFFKRTGRLLRLRTEVPVGSKTLRASRHSARATFKAPAPADPRSRYKEKLETELPVPNPERWARDLHTLGFRIGFQYEKYRTSFRLPGVYACLDETPVGAFLELEGKPATIDRTARRLGYSDRDYIRGTYWDLYADDCARRGVLPRYLLFSRGKVRLKAVFA
ncbi:MAG: class IV adenylate cyclase [Acidobacteriota bacterium]|nr:class IV adenylate cyclase [Acidobacteriota bacterium]